MDVGSLFFSLGFKSKGTTELKNYETAIDGAMTAAESMQDTFNELLYVIEKMAISMGALTATELELHKQDMKLLKATRDIVPAAKEENKQSEKKLGLLKTAHQQLSRFVGKMNAYRIELLASASALIYFTHRMSSIAEQFVKISSLTGISADQLQRISAMASEAGASVDDLGGAIQQLQAASVDIMLGKGDISPYAFLGLDPHQDPLKLLEQIQMKLKTMPTALGTKAARDLGLSDDLIYFLRNVENLKPPPEETLLTEAEVKRLSEFNFYFNRIFDQGRRVMAKFGAALTPFVNELLYAFGRMSEMFGSLFNMLAPFNKQIEILLKVLGAIALVVGAVLFPFIKWMLVIGMLLAVVEDLYSYFKGDKSVFGGLVDLVKQSVEWISKLIDKFLAMITAFTSSPIARLTETMANMISPSGPAGAGAGGGVGSVTNNNNIIVNGAKSPAEVATEVTDKINRTTSDAYYQFAPGGF